MSKYAFRSSARIRGLDAQTVGDELDRIEQINNRLDSAQVVEESRPEDAPLHQHSPGRTKRPQRIGGGMKRGT